MVLLQRWRQRVSKHPREMLDRQPLELARALRAVRLRTPHEYFSIHRALAKANKLAHFEERDDYVCRTVWQQLRSADDS